MNLYCYTMCIHLMKIICHLDFSSKQLLVPILNRCTYHKTVRILFANARLSLVYPRYEVLQMFIRFGR